MDFFDPDSVERDPALITLYCQKTLPNKDSFHSQCPLVDAKGQNTRYHLYAVDSDHQPFMVYKGSTQDLARALSSPAVVNGDMSHGNILTDRLVDEAIERLFPGEKHRAAQALMRRYLETRGPRGKNGRSELVRQTRALGKDPSPDSEALLAIRKQWLARLEGLAPSLAGTGKKMELPGLIAWLFPEDNSKHTRKMAEELLKSDKDLHNRFVSRLEQSDVDARIPVRNDILNLLRKNCEALKTAPASGAPEKVKQASEQAAEARHLNKADGMFSGQTPAGKGAPVAGGSQMTPDCLRFTTEEYNPLIAKADGSVRGFVPGDFKAQLGDQKSSFWEKWKKPVLYGGGGAAAGALLGFILGGPLGALIGAALGAAGGAMIGAGWLKGPGEAPPPPPSQTLDSHQAP